MLFGLLNCLPQKINTENRNFQKPIESLNIVDIESVLLQEKSSDKKVALATGSSRGIGKKVAKKLAQKKTVWLFLIIKITKA